MSQTEQAVWTVYDKLRTARLNVKYYGSRLEQAEHWGVLFQIILLASAPTSALSGLWFWNNDIGKVVWQWFGAIAALTSIVNAAYAPNRKIKLYESVLVGYRTLEYDLMEIKSAIEQKGKYDSNLQKDFNRALLRERSLVGKNPETRPNKKTLLRCEEEVRKELPNTCFFIPEF
jgi:hypothetical protein